MRISKDDKLAVIENFFTARNAMLNPNPDQIVHYCKMHLGDEHIDHKYAVFLNYIVKAVDTCNYEKLVKMAAKQEYSLSLMLMIENRLITLPDNVVTRINRSRNAYLEDATKRSAKAEKMEGIVDQGEQLAINDMPMQESSQAKETNEYFEKLIIALGNEIVCLQKTIEAQNREITAIGKTVALACERLGFLPDASAELVSLHKEQNVNFDMLHRLIKDQTESIKTTIRKEVNK